MLHCNRFFFIQTNYYYYYHYHPFENFSTSALTDQSPQVSGTLLSILADVNNAVVWMFLSLSFYFQVFRSIYQFFGDRFERTSCNSYPSRTFMFYSFFLVLLEGLCTYLSFSFLFNFTQKSNYSANFLFFFFFLFVYYH